MIAHGRVSRRCLLDARGMGSPVSFDNITVRRYKQLRPRASGKEQEHSLFFYLAINALSVMATKLSKYGSR